LTRSGLQLRTSPQTDSSVFRRALARGEAETLQRNSGRLKAAARGLTVSESNRRREIRLSYYEVLLFLHIVAAAVWFGGGFLLLLLAARMSRRSDTQGLETLFRQANFIAKIFIPSGLLLLLVGILMVLEGPWSFGDLWIVLGLVGYATTFGSGMLIIRPEADRIVAALERDGGMTAESAAATAQMFRHMRFEYVVIAVVIADMVFKPTTEDVGTLAVMAAVVAVAAVLIFRRGQASSIPEPG
jgi:uncharacterized membrane protein